MNSLNINLDFGTEQRIVGKVAWIEKQRRAAIEWDSDFIANPLPISPYAIRSLEGLYYGPYTPFDGLPGVLADSLPDGWGRLLVDRETAQKKKRVDDLTPVDRLAIIGRHGMGAICYQPEDPWNICPDITPDWFINMRDSIDNDISIEDLYRLRMANAGSAGARPKFVALFNPETGILRDSRNSEEEGFAHYLIKARSLSDSGTATREEMAYSEMARAAGIDMLYTELIKTRSGEDLFATRRFDRPGNGRRLHMHSVSAILNADFSVPSVDYETVLKLTGFMTKNHSDIEEMFRRMVFNVLAHNRDDHIKNHAFLMDDQGTWRLSPAYDLSFSDGPGGEHSLCINGNGRNPSYQDIVAVGEGAMIKKHRISDIIGRVRDGIRQWEFFADIHGIPAKRRKQIRERLDFVDVKPSSGYPEP